MVAYASAQFVASTKAAAMPDFDPAIRTRRLSHRVDRADGVPRPPSLSADLIQLPAHTNLSAATINAISSPTIANAMAEL